MKVIELKLNYSEKPQLFRNKRYVLLSPTKIITNKKLDKKLFSRKYFGEFNYKFGIRTEKIELDENFFCFNDFDNLKSSENHTKPFRISQQKFPNTSSSDYQIDYLLRELNKPFELFMKKSDLNLPKINPQKNLNKLLNTNQIEQSNMTMENFSKSSKINFQNKLIHNSIHSKKLNISHPNPKNSAGFKNFTTRYGEKNFFYINNTSDTKQVKKNIIRISQNDKSNFSNKHIQCE
jgi:hypothetical protein